MQPKWEAFTSWLILPYLSYVIVIPVIMVLFRRDVAFASLLQWKAHAYVLEACALPAVLGTVILWLLPIRRTWIGIVVGLMLALGGMALWVQLRVTFWGGFEANAGTAATTMALLLPSCLAGAHAGSLRSRERKSEIPK
jgi:hypothetical protein